MTPFVARFEYEDDHAVELEVNLEDGTVVCDGIRLERNPGKASLTASELRRLGPYLAGMIEQALSMAAMTPRPSAPGKGAWGPARDEELSHVKKTTRRRMARRSVGDNFLKEVALVYRNNLDQQPRQAVAEAFTVAPSTATRYIKLAREKGFLGPAPRSGKAGEA